MSLLTGCCAPMLGFWGSTSKKPVTAQKPPLTPEEQAKKAQEDAEKRKIALEVAKLRREDLVKRSKAFGKASVYSTLLGACGYASWQLGNRAFEAFKDYNTDPAQVDIRKRAKLRPKEQCVHMLATGTIALTSLLVSMFLLSKPLKANLGELFTKRAVGPTVHQGTATSVGTQSSTSSTGSEAKDADKDEFDDPSIIS